MKKFCVCCVLLLFSGLFVAGFYQFAFSPLTVVGDSFSSLKLPRGVGASYLLNQLKQKQLIHYPPFYRPFVYAMVYKSHLKTGEYAVNRGDTVATLLHRVLHGDVLVRQFTLPEGWHYQDLRHALQQNSHLKHQLPELNDQELQQQLGSEQRNLEGLFFPDTYFYTWGDSDFDLLKQAFVKMQIVLAAHWQNRQPDLPYKTPYEALIAASLIEKETALSEERALVSSVIVNRLNKKMRLQIDASVLYGLDSDKNALTRGDLSQDSAYNTYTRSGLPPTPIAFAGEASIMAALHPAASDYFYYVAKKDGSHQFSHNYQQHLLAVKRRYQKDE